MLQRVGIRVIPNFQTKTLYFDKISIKGGNRTSFFLLGWTPNTFDVFNTLQNVMTMHPEGHGIFNCGRYSNPQVEQLTLQIQQETDPEKRNALVREAFRIHQEDVGHIPLHQQYGTALAKGFAFGFGLQLIEASVGIGVGMIFLALAIVPYQFALAQRWMSVQTEAVQAVGAVGESAEIPLRATIEGRRINDITANILANVTEHNAEILAINNDPQFKITSDLGQLNLNGRVESFEPLKYELTDVHVDAALNQITRVFAPEMKMDGTIGFIGRVDGTGSDYHATGSLEAKAPISVAQVSAAAAARAPAASGQRPNSAAAAAMPPFAST